MKCPHCGKLLPDYAVFCGKCGKAITIKKAPKQPLPEPQAVTCPNCGSPLPDNAAFCTNCGIAVNFSEPPKPELPEPQTIHCPHCGSPLSEDAAFCSNCGQAVNFSEPPKQKHRKNPKTKRSKLPLLIAVCVLVLAAAGVGAWIALGGGSLSSLLHRGPQPLGPCTSVVCSYDVETDKVNQEFYDENGGHLYTIATNFSTDDSTLFVYDMYGNTTNTVQSSLPLAEWYDSIITSQSMEYNSDRQIQSKTTQTSYGSSLNITNSTYVYDDEGKLLCVREIPDDDPLEALITTYTYNSAGQPLQELTLSYLGEDNNMTRYVYNNSGLIAQKTTFSDLNDQYQTEFYTYDDENRVIRQVSYDDNVYTAIDSEYNADGQKVRRSAVGSDRFAPAHTFVAVYDYNPDGTLSTSTSSYPGGSKNTTTITYTYTDGNLTGLVKDYGASGKTEYAFTSSPEFAAVRISSTDEPPVNCSWTFSDTGTSLSVTKQDDNTTAELNQDWNLTSYTLIGNTWTHEYDENRHLIRSAGPDADDYEERQYNEQGLLSSFTNANEHYQYTYNKDGKLIQMTDADSSMSYTLSYDDSGNPVSVVVPGEGSLDLSYDGYLLTDCIINEGDRQELHYTYSSGGLLTGLSGSDSYSDVVQVTYNAAGCTEHYYYKSDYDGEKTDEWWSYDSVTGMPVVTYSTSDRTYHWEYDQAGRLTSEEVQNENTGGYWKYTWIYDSAGRLIYDTYTSETEAWEDTYSYDENGLFAE